MKNALFLVGMWLGIILFAYAVVYLPGDRTGIVSLPGDVEMADDVNGFSLPLPLGWSLRPIEGGSALVAPVAGIEAWAVTVAATTAEEAVAAAWDLLDPCSSCERSAILASAPPSGGREGAVLTLGPDGNGRTGAAVVLLVDRAARVLLVRYAADANLPERVRMDLSRILSGFRAFEVASPVSEASA